MMGAVDVKLRNPEPVRLRLSREALDVLDGIACELDCTRKVSVGLLSESLKKARQSAGESFSRLLLGGEPFRLEEFDGRRRGAMRGKEDPVRLPLTRETLDILDTVCRELAPDCPRRVPIELMTRAIGKTREITGSTYSALLVGDRPYRLEDSRGRRKAGVS